MQKGKVCSDNCIFQEGRFEGFKISLDKDHDWFHNVGHVDTRIISGIWHDIKLIVQGDNFRVFLGNRLLLNVYDHNAILEPWSFYFII
jgi:hypothetical protein